MGAELVLAAAAFSFAAGVLRIAVLAVSRGRYSVPVLSPLILLVTLAFPDSLTLGPATDLAHTLIGKAIDSVALVVAHDALMLAGDAILWLVVLPGERRPLFHGLLIQLIPGLAGDVRRAWIEQPARTTAQVAAVVAIPVALYWLPMYRVVRRVEGFNVPWARSMPADVMALAPDESTARAAALLADGRTIVLDGNTGAATEVSQLPFRPVAAASRGTNVFAIGGGQVACIHASRIRWAVPRGTFSRVFAGDAVVLVSSATGAAALDAASGQDRWGTTAPVEACCAVPGGRVAVLMPHLLVIADERTGARRAAIPVSSTGTWLAPLGYSRIVVARADGPTEIADIATRRVEALGPATAASAQPAACASGVLIPQSRGSLILLRANGEPLSMPLDGFAKVPYQVTCDGAAFLAAGDLGHVAYGPDTLGGRLRSTQVGVATGIVQRLSAHPPAPPPVLVGGYWVCATQHAQLFAVRPTQ